MSTISNKNKKQKIKKKKKNALSFLQLSIMSDYQTGSEKIFNTTSSTAAKVFLISETGKEAGISTGSEEYTISSLLLYLIPYFTCDLEYIFFKMVRNLK